MGETIDIFRLSGMKYPIHILTSTFSTVSLEIARSGFSFDISSHPAKIEHIDKAKPSVRVGRKATGL
jgi:hypothetical protein